MTTKAPNLRTVGNWLDTLSARDAHETFRFQKLYGENRALWAVRERRIVHALMSYHEQFGDAPVRVFRAPGRINLRGMHVDTHGGYLNLMTHQREVIVVAGLGDTSRTEVRNTDQAFAPLSINRYDIPAIDGTENWATFIEDPSVRAHVGQNAGHWRNYVEGAWLRAEKAVGGQALRGLNIVVDSDLPRGAALSSSAALCIALIHAWLGWNRRTLVTDELILAAQDAEWYTGSRCGTCDQTAIVLGRPGQIIHGALFPKAFTTAEMTPVALPEALRVVVVNSHTRRSISGADKAAYTLNRFAYSMALEIFRQTLREMGHPEALVQQCDRLSHITEEALGGVAPLLAVLKRIPESIDLKRLQARYELPDFDQEFARYFGDVSESNRPEEIGLRGPLLYGIAESGRARHFVTALNVGDYALAGNLMTWGHEGDRRRDVDGRPTRFCISDAALDHFAATDSSVYQCPGYYGASAPALDWLVDRALEHGALGASLTGAGIAGTVLALCRKEDAETVAAGVRGDMATDHYRRIAALPEALSSVELEEAVVENNAVAGACELGDCLGASVL
jgi:galactokinase